MNKSTSGLTNGRVQRILFFVILAIIFVLIYLLNRIYPLLGDDWQYAYIWTPGFDSPDRISGIGDILVSQYNHYLYWGGRTVNHTIVQFLLMLDPVWYNLLNSLMYVALIALIYKIVNAGNKLNLSLLILIALALWFLLPDLTSTVLWITYSGNYLWSCVIVLLFVYPYLRYYRGSQVNKNILYIPIMFVAGLITGWTNENVSVALIVFIALLIGLYKYDKISIPKWAIVGLIGVIIGCLLLLLAPGNYIRLETAREVTFSARLYVLCKNYFYYMLVPFLIYALMLFICRKELKNKEKIVWIKISFLFFIFAHAAFFAMIASIDFPARTLFGPVVFMIITIGLLFANVELKAKLYKIINISVIAVLLVFFSIDYISKYKYTLYLNGFWHQRELFVMEQKQKGIIDIEFKGNLEMRDDFNVYRLGNSSDDWINKIYARYYGVRSVKQGEW